MNKFEMVKKGLDAEKVRIIEIVIDGEHLFTDITSLVSTFMHIANEFGRNHIVDMQIKGDEATIYLARTGEPKPCKAMIEGNKIKHEIYGSGDIIEEDEKYIKAKFESGEKLLSKEVLGL